MHAALGQGFKNRIDLENRFPSVLPKTVKTGWFSVENLIFKI
jgi:hypothetical protein